MLQDLPNPVQRYLTYTGIVGKPFVRTGDITITELEYNVSSAAG